jgi:GntR family transcriptional regulator
MHRDGRCRARVGQYGFMVDHGSSVPVYVQVADDLRRRITAGEYAPGQRLPSAEDLHEIYDVAPNTARKALLLLREEGLAVMTHGRGTFVRRPGLLSGS